MPGADGWVRVAEPWIYASPTTITVPSGALNKYRKYDKVKLWQAGIGPKFYYITNVSDTLLTVDPADMGTDTLSNAAIDPDHNYSRELQPTGWPDGAERMPRLDVYDSFSVGGKNHYMYFESDENASPPGLQIWGPSEFNGDVAIWGGLRVEGKLLWSGTWTSGNISAPGIHLYKNFLIKTSAHARIAVRASCMPGDTLVLGDGWWGSLQVAAAFNMYTNGASFDGCFSKAHTASAAHGAATNYAITEIHGFT